MTCLSNVKFNMVATIGRNYKKDVQPGGSFQSVYDPVTGLETSVWVQTDLIPDDGNPSVTMSVPCLVIPAYTVSQANDLQYKPDRIVDTERLLMKVPAKYHIYTTDRVLSIMSRTGDLIYEDDQVPNDGAQYQPGGKFKIMSRPAVYNVVGVLPVADPFGRVIERQIELNKAN